MLARRTWRGLVPLTYYPLLVLLFLFFLGAVAKLRKETVSFVMSVRPSVCPHGTTRNPTGRIFVQFDIWVYLYILLRKFNFHYNATRITSNLHEDQCTGVSISRLVLPRMRNVSYKICRENQSTYFVFNNFFFLRKSCRLWNNAEKYCRTGQATDDNVSHALCMLNK